MPPVEGFIDKKKINVGVGQKRDEFLDRLAIRVEGQGDGGNVIFKQDPKFSTDIKTTGKPLVSISGETITAYLKDKQTLEIVGQQEEIVFKGKGSKSKKRK